jgi:hypothetical protein
MFAPDVAAGAINSGKPAFGRLDAEGCFILGTYDESDGAIVGDHSATISRRQETSASGATSAAPISGSGPNFRSIVVTGRFHVSAGVVNKIDIAITRDELNRFARFGN